MTRWEPGILTKQGSIRSDMGKGRNREVWTEDGEIEQRNRSRSHSQDSQCESCGTKTGKKRFTHGTEVGLFCDICWQDILDEQ